MPPANDEHRDLASPKPQLNANHLPWTSLLALRCALELSQAAAVVVGAVENCGSADSGFPEKVREWLVLLAVGTVARLPHRRAAFAKRGRTAL